MFTTPMVRLLAVVLEHDADRIAEVLLDHGVMHFMDVSDLKEGWSHKLKPLDETSFIPGITDIRKRIEEWQKNGWCLHTYQATGTSGNPSHFLLFERGA